MPARLSLPAFGGKNLSQEYTIRKGKKESLKECKKVRKKINSRPIIASFPCSLYAIAAAVLLLPSDKKPRPTKKRPPRRDKSMSGVMMAVVAAFWVNGLQTFYAQF